MVAIIAFLIAHKGAFMAIAGILAKEFYDKAKKK